MSEVEKLYNAVAAKFGVQKKFSEFDTYGSQHSLSRSIDDFAGCA